MDFETARASNFSKTQTLERIFAAWNQYNMDVFLYLWRDKNYRNSRPRYKNICNLDQRLFLFFWKEYKHMAWNPSSGPFQKIAQKNRKIVRIQAISRGVSVLFRLQFRSKIIFKVNGYGHNVKQQKILIKHKYFFVSWQKTEVFSCYSKKILETNY